MITHMSNGDPIPAGCEIGVFIPETDENTHTITHSLGEVPKFAVCLLIPNKSYDDVMAGSIVFEDLASNPATGIYDDAYDGNHRRNDVVSVGSTPRQYYATNTYTTYIASMTSTEVTFTTGRYYSGQFKANNTYIYILTK